MKSSQVLAAMLQAHVLLAGKASALWTRGAAERALYYSIYVMEDIMGSTDPSFGGDGFKIAPDCKGSRATGSAIFRVANRCTLGEFLDHIWRETPTNNKGVEIGRDTRPNTVWPENTKTVSGAMQIISFIEGAKDASGNQVALHAKAGSGQISQYGHMGFVDEEKLWPSKGLTNSLESFFKSLELCGERAKEINDYWNKAKADKKLIVLPEQKGKHQWPQYDDHIKAEARYNKHLEAAKEAAQITRDFRVQDLKKYIKVNGRWKLGLGTNAVFDTVQSRSGKVGSWFEVNRDRTVAEMVKDLKISPAEAGAKFDAHLASIQTGQGYLGHQAAITNIEKTMRILDNIDVVCQ
ncbi:hypothetical protein MAPG_09336 [Magnaporthiopsis poae ATCC 64411]|uniref:Uncharacterized protein n=1 Tax=Magnaporthiopsis poae (strain ATCC 64411 / 73-15) TaxID=644358 RepID=A0A0C4E9P0_MAGP6|nr:hypothetical protein MAPG_09336 [Magnaporthiopsis poae ATCC 64411]